MLKPWLSIVMGEDAAEKKVDPKAGGRRKPFHHRRNANSNQPKTEKYSAPTEGLQHLVWTIGTASDATNYITVKEALAKYIGACGKYKKCTKEAIMAVDEQVEPTFTDPPDPPPKSEPPTMEETKAWMTWESGDRKSVV